MENLINLDLNKLVSNQVKTKITDLENSLQEFKNKNRELNNELQQLKNQINAQSLLEDLINNLQTTYNQITETKESNHVAYQTKSQNQYHYIKKVLVDLFKLEISFKVPYFYKNSYKISNYLALEFYNDRDILINLLKILQPNFNRDLIKNLVLPQNFTKDQVLKYVKNPHYNTNGCHYKYYEFYIESGFEDNIPHDLIQANKFILEEDVFKEVINTINKKRGEYHLLFTLPKYNQLSEIQIQKLGECLIGLETRFYTVDHIEKFIKTNLTSFNKKTLDYLFKFVDVENQYKLFYWTNFPLSYQKALIFSKSFEEMYKLITKHDCKYTVEEKQNLLNEWFQNNKNGNK